jgi:TPR repeat protein
MAQDFAEAMKWYRKAADQGYAEARYHIGFMYELARGVAQDYAEAARWYRKAADQGYPVAQLALGDMYGMGRGVPNDYVQAYMWCSLAAAHGAADRRPLLEYGMTPAQIEQAKALVAAWKPKMTGQ